ncbi:protein aurora borealis [Thalassophryne amazonica]|uniref:protein aurora borealis n=1 Tax=Thalassophryne amazonica TaxID=390379 RepID=UPI001470FC66|nr:protein aurora borealis [Thalassophryne amazonica]
MGDVEIQITPETPGKPSIQNPFESPNDYHQLREPLVPSPSVFKSKPCKATPPKFNWSIDEMASLLPVDIDPEEIQRQNFYLSQSIADSDIEEKRQDAIEEFFTKGAIVPSPWVATDIRKASQIYRTSSMSPVIVEEPEKCSVACQTALSLPFGFDLEKLLGEHYHYEEAGDAVQDSLSTSSLRRKLFLDGQSSISDCSNPPSPEKSHFRAPLDGKRTVAQSSEGQVVSSSFSSPLSCQVPTPSTGQFSSSPIQHSHFRDCSLSSITSQLFPDRSSPACFVSPTVSPIVSHATQTPTGSAEGKQQTNLTLHGAPLTTDATSCTESPLVEGCSPIHSCSPHWHTSNKSRFRARCWASPPLISTILSPPIQDSQALDDQIPFTPLPFMALDPSSSLDRNVHPIDTDEVSLEHLEPVKPEVVKDVKMEERLEETEGYEEEIGASSGRLTSSRMGNMSTVESSQMSVSLLAEGSSIRCESSMQVDSGYNTTSAGTASLIDGLYSDCQSKESFNSNLAEEAFSLKHIKAKKACFPGILPSSLSHMRDASSTGSLQ